jgi:hypothetical protein
MKRGSRSQGAVRAHPLVSYPFGADAKGAAWAARTETRREIFAVTNCSVPSSRCCTSRAYSARTSENSRYAKFALRTPDEKEPADVFMDAYLHPAVRYRVRINTNGTTELTIRVLLLDVGSSQGWRGLRSHLCLRPGRVWFEEARVDRAG